MSVYRRIEEDRIPGMPLGRHVNHDDRSRAYAVKAGVVRSAVHKRRVPIFDQGNLGSCTGNALVGSLGTDPITSKLADASINESLAVTIYSEATHLDPFKGEYPPTDTGSDGLSVAKAAKARGLIAGYQHAFDLGAALSALSDAPVITGINWYDSFDRPDSTGLVSIPSGARVRGGHEVEVLGVDADNKTITMANSWGTGWGKGGYFRMTWDTWDRLLSEQGDVTVLTPVLAPPPPPPVPATPDDLFAVQVKAWLGSPGPTHFPTFAKQARAWLASRGN
jgi:Papain family cysteine protease